MKKFKDYFLAVKTEAYDESKMLDKYLNGLDDKKRKEIENKFADDIALVRKRKAPVKATLDKIKRASGESKGHVSLINRITGAGLVKEDKETIASFLEGKQQLNLKIYDQIMARNSKTSALVSTIKPSELAAAYSKALSSGDEAKIDEVIENAIKIFKAMDKIEGWVYNGEPVFPVEGKRQTKKVTEKKSIRQANIELEKVKKEARKSNKEFRDKVLYPAISREISKSVKVLSKTGREREIMKSELDEISPISLQDAIKKFWKARSRK